MHGRQGCLVACVRTAPSVGKSFQTHQTQPDVAHKYRTHRTHRTQSPGQESQDATLLYQMQATFLLMHLRHLLCFASSKAKTNMIVLEKIVKPAIGKVE